MNYLSTVNVQIKLVGKVDGTFIRLNVSNNKQDKFLKVYFNFSFNDLSTFTTKSVSSFDNFKKIILLS